MNKHFRQFMVLTLGCAIAFSGASFADTEKDNQEKAVSISFSNTDSDDMENCSIEDEMKYFKDIYALSDADANSLQSILEDIEQIDGDSENTLDALTKKLNAFDAILEPYESDVLKSSEVLDWDTYLKELEVDASTVDSNDLSKAENLYSQLVEAQKSGDVDSYLNTELEICNYLFDESDLLDTSEFDTEIVTDENAADWMPEYFKDLTLDAFLSEFEMTLSDADKASAETLLEDIKTHVQNKDFEKATKALEAFANLVFGDLGDIE